MPLQQQFDRVVLYRGRIALNCYGARSTGSASSVAMAKLLLPARALIRLTRYAQGLE